MLFLIQDLLLNHFPQIRTPESLFCLVYMEEKKKMGRKQKDATQITQIAVLSFLIRKCNLKKNTLFIYFWLCRVFVAAQAFL